MPLNQDEILDLVNEHDEVIGEVLKVKANRDPSLWHREVAIILFDNDHRILFQKRSTQKEVNPGRWAVTCAGHITKGLTSLEAAHMELREELGFDTPLVFIGKDLYKGPNETHFTYWFIGKYANQKITLETEEVEETKLLNETELDEMIKDGADFTGSVIMARRFWEGTFDEFIKQLS